LITDPPNAEMDVPTYLVCQGVDPQKARTKWKYLIAARRVRRLMNELQPDLLFAIYATSCGLIARLSGFHPYVVSVRGSDLHGSISSRIWQPVLRSVFRASTLVHTVSEGLAESVQALGIPEDRTVALTQGVDLARFQFHPQSDLHRPLRILCTRTLAQVYNPTVILEACSRLCSAGFPFHLTFAASGPDEQKLKSDVVKNGIAKHVTFLGGFRNCDLPQLLPAHDVYLSASKWDGTSISLLEAMAVGVFPVVSRIESNQQWVDDKQTCLMFDPQDSAELASSITLLASGAVDWRRSVLRNRERVEAKADRVANMSTLERLFNEIARKTSSL
jgi:glycosyltransferase involved in cell wall biosynthesis